MPTPTNPKTIVYVDGFNFYYGALKGTRFRWIDLLKLSKILVPSHEIIKINYYTSILDNRSEKSTAQRNQQLYLRALQTLDSIEIILGLFRTHEVFARRSKARGREWIWKTEEKGSDVNIGVDMVKDACLGRYECAILISNDSDLARTVDTVVFDFDLQVGVINPFKKKPTATLVRNATFTRTIRSHRVLQRAQFPDKLRDKKGIFYKPENW